MQKVSVTVRPLLEEDKPYALSSMRESHHQGAAVKNIPWSTYKREYGSLFRELLNHSTSLVLGAYRDSDGELMGFLLSTPGKRIDVLHWVQCRYADRSGEKVRRQGVMNALLEAAELGTKFIYTLRARKHNETSLDEVLAKSLAAKGVTAVYTPMKEWLQ